MHLSPLFSSKKIVLSPLSPAGFFFCRGFPAIEFMLLLAARAYPF
jgi:hypothetical protein